MKDPIVTNELIERLKTNKGGWTKESLSYLGIVWKPKKGWKDTILNKPRKPL